MTPKILLSTLAVAALAVAGCGGASDDSSDSSASAGGGGAAKSSLSLVAYSTPEVVYDEIIPEFSKTEEGKGVKFKTSYGASGEQSRAVAAGLKADVVDVLAGARRRQAGRRRPGARGLGRGPSRRRKGGFVTNSLVSFIVRKGNPKNIKTWDDLVKPGVKVVTPNPFTSGAAKWNLLGAFQHGGIDFVEKLIRSTSRSSPSPAARRCRRSPAARATCCSPTSTSTRPRSRRVRRTSTGRPRRHDPDREPDRGHDCEPEGQGVRGLRPERRRPSSDSPTGAIARSTRRCSRRTRPSSRSPRAVTIDDLGGWEKVNKELFDRGRRLGRQDRGGAGVSTAK